MIVLPACKLKSANLIFYRMVSTFIYAFQLLYVKTHTALPMVFIAVFFFMFLSKCCNCGYYDVAKNGKYFSFTTASLPVKY